MKDFEVVDPEELKRLRRIEALDSSLITLTADEADTIRMVLGWFCLFYSPWRPLEAKIAEYAILKRQEEYRDKLNG